MTRRGTELMIFATIAMMVASWLPARQPRAPARVVARPLRSTQALAAELAGETPAGIGRDADAPSEIPARGWWQILKRIAIQFSEDRVMAEAAGVTFFVLLAIFPALGALVSVYGLIADPHAVASDLNGLAGLIPGGGMDLIEGQLKNLTASGQNALGFGALAGFAVSLWSANAGMKALFDALNAVYDEKETRGFFRLTAQSLCFTICSLLFMMLAMGGVVVLPAVLAFVGFGGTTDFVLRIGRWPALMAAITLFLAFVYRFGPSRAKARWRWLSCGGVFAAVTWVIASAGFSWYVANFGSYNKTYGSLGAVVGFMTWIWISTMIVLVGAELNAEMEHQTAHDTTVGPARPLGLRGAVKADTLAGV